MALSLREILVQVADSAHEVSAAAAQVSLLALNAAIEAARAGISERIEAFTMQINQIATAAEEQTATTSEISQSLLQVTDVVQGTASSAREFAVAAAQLNGAAQQLQRLVGRFRLA